MGYLIGLDGGGTRTHAIVASVDGEILGTAWAGPSNVMRVGEARTRESVARAVDDALDQAQQDQRRVGLCAPWRLEVACAGFAGADRPQVRDTLMRVLQETLERGTILLCSDAEIALAGSHGSGPGVVVLSGSGSIALARDPSGRIVRCGGWGWLLGDEGAATDIARRAITRALQEYDGRAETSALLPALLDHFGLQQPDEIVWKVHQNAAPASVFSGFFPRVLRAAQAGDAAAIGLLEAAGRSLADLAQAVVRPLVEPADGWSVVYGGSVLVHSQWTQDAFVAGVRQNLTDQIFGPRGAPAEGAVHLAADHYRKTALH